jgi:hypothetical protein
MYDLLKLYFFSSTKRLKTTRLLVRLGQMIETSQGVDKVTDVSFLGVA